MSATALLEDLRGQGARLWLEGEELRLRGSKKVPTPDILDQIRGRKPEIVALIRSNGRGAPEASAEVLEGRCHHGTPGGCWLCRKYGQRSSEVPEPTVGSLLEDPPYWLRSYLRGYQRGNVGLYVLSGAVAAAMGHSPHEMAEELLPAVRVYAPAVLALAAEEPERVVA